MREVRLDLGIFLEDDVADYVSSLKSKGSLDSLIAEFLSKSFNGGYIVTQEQIDGIIDDMFDEEDESGRVLTDNDTTAISEVVSDTLKRLLQDMKLSPTVVSDDDSSVKLATVEEEEKLVANIVTFTGAAESVSVSGGDGEEMSEDDADDLAAIFGL